MALGVCRRNKCALRIKHGHKKPRINYLGYIHFSFMSGIDKSNLFGHIEKFSHVSYSKLKDLLF